MKKTCCAMLLAFCLLLSPFAQAEVDVSLLQSALPCEVFSEENGVDTVYRPEGQPYAAETEDGRELIAYVDYIDMPNLDGVYVRITLSMASPEPTALDHGTLFALSASWTFPLTYQVHEYDDTYYEDYSFLLDEGGMVLLSALARKDTPISFILAGETTQISASLTLPCEDMARIYDAFTRAGGMEQDFSRI